MAGTRSALFHETAPLIGVNYALMMIADVRCHPTMALPALVIKQARLVEPADE
ncbi:MAG: hypothetical protein AAGC71_08395 [Pseudomonadota bacterium]